MNSVARTALRVLTEDLGLRAYKSYIEHLGIHLRRLLFERSKKDVAFYDKNLFKKYCSPLRKLLL